jgi:hypothetical protein
VLCSPSPSPLGKASYYEEKYYKEPKYDYEYQSRYSYDKYGKYGEESYGYSKYGYDKYGYSKDGYDKYGYSKDGYDKYGECVLCTCCGRGGPAHLAATGAATTRAPPPGRLLPPLFHITLQTLSTLARNKVQLRLSA